MCIIQNNKKQHLHQVCKLFKTLNTKQHILIKYLCIHLLFRFPLFSPGDGVNSLEQQIKLDSVAEIETAEVKETAIADHEETGDESGINTHAPLLTESGEKDFEGEKDHSTGINIEGIQRPYDASDKDHSTDPPATTLVMVESDKDACDAELVSAGKLESSGGGDIGTVSGQEAVDVADHERTQGKGDNGILFAFFNVDIAYSLCPKKNVIVEILGQII
jgi:hypothetical protein